MKPDGVRWLVAIRTAMRPSVRVEFHHFRNGMPPTGFLIHEIYRHIAKAILCGLQGLDELRKFHFYSFY
jgi:hypothetical protein